MSSGALSDGRDSLATALAPLGQVHAILPERFTPPAVLLQPADPMLTTDGRPYRMGDLHYRVVLIVRGGTNPAQEAAITEWIEDALDAIHASTHEWTVQSVSAPYDLQTGTATHLAVRLEVSAPIRITT